VSFYNPPNSNAPAAFKIGWHNGEVTSVALRLEDKKAIVAEVANVAATALSAVAASYRGISVSDMTTLRKNARENGVYLRVVRNTLAKRAVAGTDFECMQEGMTGPLVLAFSVNDPGASARLLKDFAKSCEALEIKMLSVSGKVLPASQIDVLATLPTYDQAISQLMSVMQAPITKFVRTLAAPHTKLVRTVDAIRDQKQAN
jgi:large subunit ribosomal protein L10